MEIRQIPAQFATERLYVKDIEPNEIGAAQALYESSAYMGRFDGHARSDTEYIARCLREGDLPPQGDKQFFRMQLVRRRVDDEALGLLSVYHGYPRTDVLYLGFLFITTKQQGRGLGSELASHVEWEAYQAGFRWIRLGVALKNWHALRFWVRHGFRNITAITGDLEYADTSFATVELEKKLESG